MAWLSVDITGNEFISQNKPTRTDRGWETIDDKIINIEIGTIVRLTGVYLTWKDEPVKHTVIDHNAFYAFVCSKSGCSISDLYKKTRKREVVWARQIIIAYRKTYMNLSYENSAKEFGLDHSTAVHAFKKIKELSHDSFYKRLFNDIFEEYPLIINYKFKQQN